MSENNTFKSGKYQVIDKKDGRVIAHLTCGEKTVGRVKKMMEVEYRIIREDGKEVKDEDGGGC